MSDLAISARLFGQNFCKIELWRLFFGGEGGVEVLFLRKIYALGELLTYVEWSEQLIERELNSPVRAKKSQE